MSDVRYSLTGPYIAPPPAYSDDAFEPIISASTVRAFRLMQQEHIRLLNAGLELHPQWLGLTIEELLRRLSEMPPELRELISGHGAGHANFQFLWKILRPTGSQLRLTSLLRAIERDFGSQSGLLDQLEELADASNQNGWLFLVINPERDFSLQVLFLEGDASVLPLNRLGLFVLNLWEPAWRDQYGNRRAWVRACWDLIDWITVASRYQAFLGGATRV